jgi:RNA polymerase sigma-70 factor, ECF subfamily
LITDFRVRRHEGSMVFPLGAAAVPIEPAGTRVLERFETIYAHYFRAVWRTLRRLGVTPAQLDDAAQDVFVVVHRRLPEFDGRSPRGWLYAIAVRVASDYRRGTVSRRTSPLSESLVDPALDPGQTNERRESVELLHALLGELSESKRTVFVLAELEELSVPEIAGILGENLNTVYSRVRAARADFESALHRHRLRTERRTR